MVANELNRAQNALEKAETDDAIHAWERAFELTDLTVEDPKNARMQRELLRFRELLGETFLTVDATTNRMIMKGLISLHPVAFSAMV